MAINDQEVAAIKFLSISKTATGDLVSAVSDKKIRVLGYTLAASAAFTAKFTSGTGPTDLTGAMSIAANGNIYGGGGSDCPACETAVGEKLALTLSGTGTVAGHLTYVLVDA